MKPTDRARLTTALSTSAIHLEPIGKHLTIDDTTLHVVLADGRELSVPIAWFPKLANATEQRRGNWRWIGGGIGIHWPDIEEDLSIRGLLLGVH